MKRTNSQLREIEELWGVWQETGGGSAESLAACGTLSGLIAAGTVPVSLVYEPAGGPAAFLEALAIALARRTLHIPTEESSLRSWLDASTCPARHLIASINLVCAGLTSVPRSVSWAKAVVASLVLVCKAVHKCPALWRSGETTLAFLVIQTVRRVVEVCLSVSWDGGQLAGCVVDGTYCWVPLMWVLPNAAGACLEEGVEVASRVRGEWGGALRMLSRLLAASSRGAQLLVSPQTNYTQGFVDVALDVADAILDVRVASSLHTTGTLLTAVTAVQSALDCIIACLTHNKVLVVNFERRGGYNIVTKLLRGFGDGFDSRAHTAVSTQQIQQLVKIPLILLAVCHMPDIGSTFKDIP